MDKDIPDRIEVEALAGLVGRAQAGDLSAFEQLVRAFQNMAVANCYAMLGDAEAAEDAAQEAFLEAYRNLAQLREPAAFVGWFRTVLRKQCDRITRRRALPSVPLDVAQQVRALGDPAASLESKQQSALVREALAGLRPGEREAVLLFHFAELPQSEIADHLGVSLDTVKNRLRSARRKLKEGLIAMTEETSLPGRPSADFADKVIRLLRAATAETPDEINALLGADPALVNAQGEHPYWLGKPVVPPLIVATEWGGADTVRELLDRGADIDWHGVSNDNWSALQLALHHGRPEHLQVAKLLIERGAQIDIWAAAAMGDAERIKVLLGNDPSLVHAKGPNDAPPLHYAASPEVVDTLLAAGADPKVRDKYGQTAAQRIASYGGRRRAAGKRLLEAMGAHDVFLSCALGDDAEVAAALKADPQLAFARTSDPLTESVLPKRDLKPVGETPLHIASQHGHAKIVSLLLAAGADVNARADGGVTALHMAAQTGQTAVAKLLLDNGAEINATEDLHGSTPYGWAVFQRRDETAAFLKARGGVAGH